jgi:valyl-tRNA synthetase
MENRYDSKEAEARIAKTWTNNKIFNFNPNTNKKVFSIDTPPPTVSGKLHIGHIMHYSQFEFVARFKRMQGFEVFFPFGFDNNGLATEILTEKENKVTAEYVGREKFIELVEETIKKYITLYKNVWNRIGISCDWALEYRTIEPRVQKISQLSFLDLYKQKRVYRDKRPIIWCPKCQTAIAQVETEDKDFSSHLCYIEFDTDIGEKITIATTRPELMSACVGVSIHPEDERYKKFIGKRAKLPIFNRSVPIIADKETKMDYGTGVVYYCTYGGYECVEWMNRHPEIKPIPIMGHDGKFSKEAGKYAGLKSIPARKEIIKDLEASGNLIKKETINHAVNVHERCGTQIEYILAKQWFIKYLDLKKEFMKTDSKTKWYPEYMRTRLKNWIEGLKWDWCISRQRFFGIPIPVWYCNKCGEVKVASSEQLPIDPLVTKPKTPCKCGSNDFTPEKDIFDTWMSSSMTPFINAKWKEKNNLMDKIYPMDLRPQAHDIITFWSFNTLVKGYLHTKQPPFKTVMISGHGLDKHGKKMSKSKGNVVPPLEMIDKYSADAVRYWAASASLGEDLPFQEKDLANGQKLINKLWNAAKFVDMSSEQHIEKPKKLTIMDEWLLTKLNHVVEEVTEGFEIYEYSRAKNKTEYFFWRNFCDNYLELVKYRLHNNTNKESALWTLNHTLLTTLKLFAPIMPYITEELYQLIFTSEASKTNSIHISKWPSTSKINKSSEEIGDLCVKIISSIRQWKQSRKLALNTKLTLVTFSCSEKEKAMIEKIIDDLKGTMKIKEIKFGKGIEEIPDTDIKFNIKN